MKTSSWVIVAFFFSVWVASPFICDAGIIARIVARISSYKLWSLLIFMITLVASVVVYYMHIMFDEHRSKEGILERKGGAYYE